jgi:hypothetical protein
MVYAGDLKSPARKGMRVRFPPPAPTYESVKQTGGAWGHTGVTTTVSAMGVGASKNSAWRAVSTFLPLMSFFVVSLVGAQRSKGSRLQHPRSGL